MSAKLPDLKVWGDHTSGSSGVSERKETKEQRLQRYYLLRYWTCEICVVCSGVEAFDITPKYGSTASGHRSHSKDLFLKDLSCRPSTKTHPLCLCTSAPVSIPYQFSVRLSAWGRGSHGLMDATFRSLQTLAPPASMEQEAGRGWFRCE